MCSICNNISLAKMIYPDRGHQGGEGKKMINFCKYIHSTLDDSKSKGLQEKIELSRFRIIKKFELSRGKKKNSNYYEFLLYF